MSKSRVLGVASGMLQQHYQKVLGVIMAVIFGSVCRAVIARGGFGI